RAQLSAPSSEPHQLEVTVDGARAQIITVGARVRGRNGDSARIIPRTGEADPDKPIDFRVSVKAGPRLIGVTFIARDEVQDESTLRPRMRGRGTEPALSLVTISGPFGAKAPGDSPSRRRLFTCPSTSLRTSAEQDACAKQILLTLTRRAYRRPTTDADVQELMTFYQKGRREAEDLFGFDRGIERALERVLVSPQFLFRIES